MPHIHAVEVLDRRGNRALARIDARRGWLPVCFTCGFALDHERLVMHRWYLGRPWRGIVETWRVRTLDDGRVSLAVSISAGNLLARLMVWAVIGPIAKRQYEMVDLLAVAHRQAHEADGWE
jgi:ribosome-associated toxin RatA of RatAB toxin-antitoxin module